MEVRFLHPSDDCLGSAGFTAEWDDPGKGGKISCLLMNQSSFCQWWTNACVVTKSRAPYWCVCLLRQTGLADQSLWSRQAFISMAKHSVDFCPRKPNWDQISWRFNQPVVVPYVRQHNLILQQDNARPRTVCVRVRTFCNKKGSRSCHGHFSQTFQPVCTCGISGAGESEDGIHFLLTLTSCSDPYARNGRIIRR